MAIRPFRDIAAKSAPNNIATRKWVLSLLKGVLGKLHFTGNVKQAADGHVEFFGGGGAAAEECNFPFMVTTEPGSSQNALRINIQAGSVRTEVQSPQWPTLAGVAINRPTNPPFFTIPDSSASWNIYLEITWQPSRVGNGTAGSFTYYNGAEIIEPPRLAASTAAIPANQNPNVDLQTLAINSPGTHYVSIATIQIDAGGSPTVVQAWAGNIGIFLLNNLNLFIASGN